MLESYLHKPWILTAKDEGYWEALLLQGKFAPPLDAPPPTHARHWVPTGVNGGRAYGLGTEDDWAKAYRLMRDEKPLTMLVSGYNRGGLLLAFHSLQGFLPVTQMLEPPENIEGLSRHVGKRLLVQVIELNREKKRLLVSERVAHTPPDARAAALSLTPGTVLEGTVSSVHFFGAFVDLGGGKEGLVHVSELDWKRVGHPQEVLEPGQQIRVVVMNVDHARRQVILSLKRMRPDPWATASRRYHPGQVLEGVVTGIAHFGVFVRLESGIEGLVHKSEMREGAAEMLQEGDRVTVEVLKVDTRRKRIALSMRSLTAE